MKFGLLEMVFFVVLLAMPVSAYWFVFRPQNVEITEARQEIQHKELMLEKLALATAKTEDLQRANTEIAASIELVESRLPGNKEVEVVLQQVADLARTNNLDLSKVKTDKPVKSARYMEQPLEMTISGDFDSFYTFLLELEQLDRITRMPELEIKKEEKVDGTMQASFTLSIYFEPEAGKGAEG
jgi:type IV pilus assembly protein PilO